MLYIVNMLYSNLKKFNGAIRRDGWNTPLSGFFKKKNRESRWKKRKRNKYLVLNIAEYF